LSRDEAMAVLTELKAVTAERDQVRDALGSRTNHPAGGAPF
jgi:hypothetical protein